MSRAVVDSNTYRLVLSNQIDYYLRQGIPRPEAITRAKQSVAGAFTCDTALDDIAFEKDQEDARRDDEWAC